MFLRLKSFSQVHFRSGDTIKFKGWVFQEPDHNLSNQIVRIGGVIVKTYQFPVYEVGQQLEVSGKVEQEFSSRNRRMTSFFNSNLAMMYPDIHVVQNQEVGWWIRILRGVARARKRVVSLYQRLWPEPQAGLAGGIVFGFNVRLPEEFYQALQKTGTVHVIVASGQNVAILSELLMLWLTAVMSRRKAIPLVILSILFYVFLSGFQVPIIRAAIMGGLSFVAMGLGRQKDGLIALVIAAMVTVAWNPGVVAEVSWQLSFAATAGILIIYPKLLQLVKVVVGKVGQKTRWWQFLGEGWAVTMAAQIATLPIILMNFGQISFIAPLVNTLIAPLVPVIMVGGGLVALVGGVVEGLAKVISWGVWVPLTLFVMVVRLLARVPGAMVMMEWWPWWGAVGYYLVLAALLLRRRTYGS